MARSSATIINIIIIIIIITFFVAILSAPPHAAEYLQCLINLFLPGTYLPENSNSIVSHFIFMNKYLLEKIQVLYIKSLDGKVCLFCACR